MAYRFPSGDMKEFLGLAAAAYSEPMALASYAVTPQALPFDHSITRQHGTSASRFLALVIDLLISRGVFNYLG